jgi:hypothetical protein
LNNAALRENTELLVLRFAHAAETEKRAILFSPSDRSGKISSTG